MPHDYFVRITHPYEKITPLVSLWSMRSEKLVVYEHVGSQTEKVHCHILIKDANIHKKQLRNLAISCLGVNACKGQENLAFKECDDKWETALVYMTKGKHDPKYMKGYSNAEAEQWKAKWVEPQHYETVPTDVKLFEEFWTDDLYEKYKVLKRPESEDMDEVVYYQFHWLKKEARSYAFGKNGGIWNQKARNIYYMCVMTACMRANIPISKKHKFAEIL